MKKVIWFNMITLDGFFEGPDRELGWHNVDEDFNTFAIEQLNTVDTLLFGRVTYALMADYWPTSVAKNKNPAIAGIMNCSSKIVFSKTLSAADWNNTRIIKGNAIEELARLKKQPGKDMMMFGSAGLATSFIQHGLIDEFRIMLNPVVIGQGHPLFKDIHRKLTFKLLNTKAFISGNVLLCYEPAIVS
jgi:dihydrofolate reductase